MSNDFTFPNPTNAYKYTYRNIDRSNNGIIRSYHDYLSIICYRLATEQVNFINRLLLKRNFFNRSEFMRKVVEDFFRDTEDECLCYQENPELPTEQVTTKFPQRLIDQTNDYLIKYAIESRSVVLRHAVHHFIKNFTKIPRGKLQSVAMKFPDAWTTIIKLGQMNGQYTNLSEFVRMAIHNLAQKYESGELIIMWIKPNYMKKTRKSFKMLPRTFKTLNYLVEELQELGYHDRSKVIRLAVQEELEG